MHLDRVYPKEQWQRKARIRAILGRIVDALKT